MDHELICTWLKIPAAHWPPDHYTLLGLRAGESDAARIERHVQSRMEWVRCYQLAHPDLVTEIMNRIAQAFDCLRDGEAKKAYDARLLGKADSVPSGSASSASGPPQVVLLPATLAGPPAQVYPSPPAGERVGAPAAPAIPLAADTIETRPDKQTIETTAASAPAAVPVAAGTTVNAAPAAAPVPAPPPPQPPLDPALEAARSSPARRGLGSKRALYQRISRTRGLIRAWVNAGKYLGDPRYRLANKNEAIDLVRQLTIIRQQLQDFPPLLGQAGQPGYLVIALARQPEIVKTYQSLPPEGRKSYVRDWQAGLTFLAAYRLFLREELRRLRGQGQVGRALRFLTSIFTDYPGLWLGFLAIVAANIAFPPLRQHWPWEVLAGAVLLSFFLFFQNTARRRSLQRSRRGRKREG